MSKVLEGFAALIVGPKLWGKSVFAVGWARDLGQQGSIRSVFYFDPVNRLRACEGFEHFYSVEQFFSWLHEHEHWPRLAMFHLGDRPEFYVPLFKHSTHHGGIAIFVDEAARFFPSGKHLVPEAERIASLCRGLPDHDGVPRKHYLILASQRATGIEPSIRDNCDLVLVGRLRGKGDQDWARSIYDVDALDHIAKLEPHQWHVLEPAGGTVPKVKILPSDL